MKVLAFILSVLLTTVLLIGAVVPIVLASPNSSGWAYILGLLGATFLVCGPLTIGSMAAYWDPAVSDRSRRYLLRLLLATIGVEVLSAFAVVVFVVVDSAPPWIAGVMIGGGAVLTALALVVGPVIRRKVVTIALTFGIVLIVGLAAILILDAGHHGKLGVVKGILFALDFASIAGAVAAIIVTLPLNRRLRGLTDGDAARIRDVAKVVLRGKLIALGDADQVAAAKYAAVTSVTIPLQLTSLVLLYIGLAMNQTVLVTDDGPSAFTIGYLIFLLLFLGSFVPLSVIRLRRARRYMAEHGNTPNRDGVKSPAS